MASEKSKRFRRLLLEDDAIELLLEPLDGVVRGHLVRLAEVGAAALALRDASARARELDEEVHAVNARGRVVLDAEIDVLRDAEAERARGREVRAQQLVLLHLQALLEDLLSLLAADRHMARDL